MFWLRLTLRVAWSGADWLAVDLNRVAGTARKPCGWAIINHVHAFLCSGSWMDLEDMF